VERFVDVWDQGRSEIAGGGYGIFEIHIGIFAGGDWDDFHRAGERCNHCAGGDDFGEMALRRRSIQEMKDVQ
jgi:hypothetical protein